MNDSLNAFYDTVLLVPGCCVGSKCSLLEAMKAKVRRVQQAYGVAKACQSLPKLVVCTGKEQRL